MIRACSPPPQRHFFNLQGVDIVDFNRLDIRPKTFASATMEELEPVLPSSVGTNQEPESKTFF